MSAPKKVSLKNLWINTENYRFEPAESQAEAIAVMVENQKDKLYNIAEHIAKKGMNPIDLPIITDMPNHKGKYLVLEGNRRLTALKLYSNPDLLKDTSASASLKKKFRDLHNKVSESIPTHAECIFFSNPNDADEWIKLKHTGENNGVGTVGWDSQQVGRFQSRVGEKSSPGLQVIDYLRKNRTTDPELKAKLSGVPVTTLTRLVTDKDVQRILGISIVDGHVVSKLPDSELLKGYSHVIKDLLKKDFSVKDVYTKEQRIEYAKKFPQAAKPNLSLAGSGQPTSSAPEASPTPVAVLPPTSKPQKASTDRAALIPKTCIINVTNHKVNRIYEELQRLKLADFVFASSALLRVFIELSLDLYVEQNGLTKNALSSAKSSTSLQGKGNAVINHMKNKGWTDDAISLEMRNMLNGKDTILSLETLQAYLHNHRVSPTDATLKLSWDGIQDFMIALWNHIK